MKIIQGRETYTTTIEKAYSYFEVIPDIYTFKLVEIETSTDPAVSDKITETQGLTRKKGLSALKKGSIPSPVKGKHHWTFIATDETLQDIMKYGYYGYAFKDSKAFENAKVYDWLESGGKTENVIILEMNDHSFWRFDGTLLPVGIRFDENEAAFHNRVYDLEKALNVLKKRGDINFPKFYKHGSQYKMELEEETDPKVIPLPNYRGDYGEKNHLTFFWRPDQETSEKLHGKTGYDLYTYIYNNDLLNLKAEGTTLTEGMYDFYDQPAKSCDCSCDCHC